MSNSDEFPTAGVVAGVVALAGLIFGGMFGIPAFNRYQTLQDEQNHVMVNEIRIRQQEQLIQVEKQKAQIRVQEAIGIAEAQKTIDQSLTQNYLQYLAIEAQKHMADSPNHTEIYIPTGQNGIPLVRTINPDPEAKENRKEK